MSDTTQQATTGPKGGEAGGCPVVLYYPCLPQDRDEIDPLDLLRILGRHWWLILLVVVLGTSGAVSYSLQAEPIFKAQAIIAPPEQKKSGGASSALAALGGIGSEIAGNIGLSVGGNDANRLEALLKSHRLIARVVSKYDLVPVLCYKRWDRANKKWKSQESKGVPNIWDAEKIFKTFFSVKNDSKTGVLTLNMEFPDISTARKVLKYFLDELALMIQEDELRKIELNRKFVEVELRRSSDPTLVGKLQTLLADQLEKAMMARNVENFAFELIDPPEGSDKQVKPNKALIGAVGLGSSLAAGIFLAFFVEWVRKVKTTSMKVPIAWTKGGST